MTRRRPSLEALERGILAGDRSLLARAITLIESIHPDDAPVAQELLVRLLPHTGRAIRVGITGVPGVGKSTLIDAFGSKLTQLGRTVAVLAVDPSSQVSGGSILGDKTRMARLSVDPKAYVRPSPSGLTPGGVAQRTRETALLCEAAGFDVVLVETVGVGQGEVAVSEMVDTFVVLMLPGAGDELQGIKKGILELADVLAVNKADADNLQRARLAAADLKSALRYVHPLHAQWATAVLTVSGATGAGLDELWSTIERHRAALAANGALSRKRAEQNASWMWSLTWDAVHRAFREHPRVAALASSLERDVRDERESPARASRRLLEAFALPT